MYLDKNAVWKSPAKWLLFPGFTYAEGKSVTLAIFAFIKEYIDEKHNMFLGEPMITVT